MKNTFIWLMGSLLLAQCVAPPEPAIDYTQRAAILMREVTPRVEGRWTIRRMLIKRQPYNHFQLKAQLTKDTIFTNFATLDLHLSSASRSSYQSPHHAEFEGTITFQNKTYPVSLRLMASSERLDFNTGPYAFSSFSYNYPLGLLHPEPEKTFLENIGLVDDTFALYLQPEHPRMIWRGLNDGVERIEFEKQ